MKSGDTYMLFLHEPHGYTYKKMENSRYYWIHFTGNRASEILDRYEILRGINRDNERKQEKDRLFAMLAEELSNCSDEASEYGVSLFFSFLSLFKDTKKRKRFYASAIKSLENLRDDESIASIASSYNISAAHFIRTFKSIYGTTPNEYRQNYRISQAINLLKMTDLSIQDIGYQCGFCDLFYFSRAFKKRVGMSPYEYRKQG